MRRNGFTLIELSIVLIIIGLIIGGVMVGRDLIESGRVRAQIGQFQEYETAVNGFRVKYNCLPGDCVDAASLGLGSNGNGNGLVQMASSAYGSYDTPDGTYSGELPKFFLHLQASGLINQKFDNSLILVGGSYPVLAINDRYGMIACGKWQSGGTGTTPGSITDLYGFPSGLWLHAIVCAIANNPGQANDGCGVMTPAQAYSIDTKLDDGKPLSGKIWGYGSGIAPITSAPCLNGSYTAYDLDNTNPHCQMSYKIQ
jgi:prepilin-type N-terminal cleavage/methylation domain-containing protein